MQWYGPIFELIDMRSFSNLWYWIALAVVWSSASHYVVGVPYDMVLRARRRGGQVQRDLEALVRIQTARLLYIGRVSGLWLIGFIAFILSMLAVLGFRYDIEFCQALFMIAFPLSLVGMISMRTARAIEHGEGQGEALYQRLRRHRKRVQLLGMASIFVTALWGMWQNMNVSVLGG
ncbi:MAG: component of SufBCD complex [Gemmobacter sp.]